ncbi:MAG TPA: hypothetical protein VJ599_00895 [Nitrososphaeraceae archaeon]|nr:hypothetical protein [Nitrososphaeraceae archaeon]
MITEKEAFIILNKHELSNGQSLTIRIALEVFLDYLIENGLGDDEHSVKMTQAYTDSINSIRRLIYRSVDKE